MVARVARLRPSRARRRAPSRRRSRTCCARSSATPARGCCCDCPGRDGYVDLDRRAGDGHRSPAAVPFRSTRATPRSASLVLGAVTSARRLRRAREAASRPGCRSRSAGCGWSCGGRWTTRGRAGRGSSRRSPRSAGGWSATCTTARSSGSSRVGMRLRSAQRRLDPASVDARDLDAAVADAGGDVAGAAPAGARRPAQPAGRRPAPRRCTRLVSGQPDPGAPVASMPRR